MVSHVNAENNAWIFQDICYSILSTKITRDAIKPKGSNDYEGEAITSLKEKTLKLN